MTVVAAHCWLDALSDKIQTAEKPIIRRSPYPSAAFGYFIDAAFTQEVFRNLYTQLVKEEYPSTLRSEVSSIKESLTTLDTLTNKRKTPHLSLQDLKTIKDYQEKALSAVKDCTKVARPTCKAIYERTDWELSMEGEGSLEQKHLNDYKRFQSKRAPELSGALLL